MNSRVNAAVPAKQVSPDALKILDMCQTIHKLAEEIYQNLAEVHCEDREAARMWGLFAIDKCNHSDTFKMAHRLKGGGIRRIHGSEEMVRGILIKMKSIPGINRTAPPTVVSALRFTVKMEELLSKVHFFHIVEFLDERDAALLTSKLQSSSSILHIMTEEYVNLTLPVDDSFE